MSQSKKLIPKRRFKGFEHTDNWNICHLEDILEFYSGLTYSPKDIVGKDGTLVLRSSNVKDGELELIDQIFVNTACVNSEYVEYGDIVVVVRNGSKHLIGKHAQIKKSLPNTVIGAFMTGIRYKIPSFITALLNTKKFNSEIEKNLGATINQITAGHFKKMGFNIPNNKEQKSIGIFFEKLDNLINTQQKKLEKAKTLKSAYLTEMFPNEGELKPKRRFIKFNDDWKVFLIKELGDIHTGNTPSTTDKINWSVGKKGHVWVTPTDIKSLLISDSERYLTDIGWEKARRIPENSILITSIASIGKNSINTVPVAFNQQINAIIPYKNNAYFILSSMEKEKKRFSQLAGHTSMAIINKTEFENFTLIIPTEQEQTKIGNFFKLLDNKIALEQKKLNKLKNIKQAYLNEMFV
jgi:type I restriction enzyme, S subunit